MDFAAVVLFLVLYYIRPQDWPPGGIAGIIALFQPIKVSVALAILSMLTRPKGLHWRDLFKTPHDYLILFYFSWMVISAPDIHDTFNNVYPYFLFYIVTAPALSSMRRIRTLLIWWTMLILILSALAVLSEWGYDPIQSYDHTHGRFRGRLVVWTAPFNNPNGLGHSIVPIVIMLYYLWFWRRPIFMKIATLPIVAIPMYCIYLTQSKGAFLSGFATTLSGFVFGRPKVMQIALLSVGLTVGVGAIYTLPRMGELNKAKAEGGIQGRIAAFQHGMHMLKSSMHGVGFLKFQTSFLRTHNYSKASHSAYVEVGAELGPPGLVLFIAILYSCFRTLWQSKTRDPEEERAKRILFVMLVAYVVSCWMVDFAYRTSFFMLVGTISAFHRLMLPKEKPAIEKAEKEAAPEFIPARASLQQTRLAMPAPIPTGTAVSLPVFTTVSNVPISGTGALPPKPETIDVESMEIENRPPGLLWNRIGWIDAAIIAAATYGTIRFWGYIMTHI